MWQSLVMDGIMKITKGHILNALVDMFVNPIPVYTMEDGRAFTVFARSDGTFLFSARWQDDGYPTYTEKEVIDQFIFPVTAKPIGTHVLETQWFVEPTVVTTER